MKRHKDKSRKPFQIGDLVRSPIYYMGKQFFLVYDFEWDSVFEEWTVCCLSQRTGLKFRFGAENLQAAENNNDNK